MTTDCGPPSAGRWANDYSGWGNEVLYRMCAERTGHGCIDTVADKLWLIGRSYAASVDRQQIEKQPNGSVEDTQYHIERTAWLMIQNGLDDQLDKVKDIDRPTMANIDRILEVHHFLTALFNKPRREGGSGHRKRSLASKYLHFHQPKAFFIFDSISSANVSREIKRLHIGLQSVQLDEADPEYASYVQRCIAYRDSYLEPVRLGGKRATPRRLDMELQMYAWQRLAYMSRFCEDSGGEIPWLHDDAVVAKPEDRKMEQPSLQTYGFCEPEVASPCATGTGSTEWLAEP